MKRASAVVVLNSDNQILAMNRFPKTGIREDWGLLGGSAEDGESPERAAARELAEESGIIVRPEELKPVTIDFVRNCEVSYFATVYDGQKIIESAEGPLSWVSAADLVKPTNTYCETNRKTLRALGFVV